MLIKLNRIQYPVYNLGPGKRIAIWVQGCTLGCEGCVSPTLWTSNGGKDVDIEALGQQIAAIAHYFDGVTFTGGEPFQQYEPLIALCAYLKHLSDLTIYTFSGYTIEELTALHPDRLFMKYMDYLIDGRYEQDKHDDSGTRGSINQRLFHFIRRGDPCDRPQEKIETTPQDVNLARGRQALPVHLKPPFVFPPAKQGEKIDARVGAINRAPTKSKQRGEVPTCDGHVDETISIKQIDLTHTPNKWSVNVSESNQIFMAGIPRKEELDDIEKHFKLLGIAVRFK